MIPARIISQYEQYCQETDFQPFSNSTMRRIIEKCGATSRKSLQGLDYFVTDGTKAFEDLDTVVGKLAELDKGSEWAHDLKERFKFGKQLGLGLGKQYLKTDYKV